jgi:thiol-disulfide isomerase/thioredoxin
MKHIIGVLGILFLVNAQAYSQVKPVFKTPPEYNEGRPLYIQGNLPDISLGKMINYKNSTAWRSDFGNKLIIFDFWNTHCGPCVKQIIHNDSIQKVFGQYLQIIMVTKEPEEDVQKFVNKWQQQHQQTLSIPVVVEDEVIKSYFWNLYHPSYSWILPTGKFVFQSSKLFINKDLITQILDGKS